MPDVNNTNNEKPKGNMLQNENREDDPLTENSSGVQQENKTKKQDDNKVIQPVLKTEQATNKP